MADSELPLLAWRPQKEPDARKAHRVDEEKPRRKRRKKASKNEVGDKNRKRSVSSRQRDQVLNCLMAAYPEPISHAAICEAVQTNRASHRIRELARSGWRLEGAAHLGLDPATQTQLYRLVSLRKGEPDVKHIGCKVLWDQTGLKVTLHRDIDGTLDADFLRDLAGAIEELVRDRVGSKLSTPEDS